MFYSKDKVVRNYNHEDFIKIGEEAGLNMWHGNIDDFKINGKGYHMYESNYRFRLVAYHDYYMNIIYEIDLINMTPTVNSPIQKELSQNMKLKITSEDNFLA